MREFGKYNPNVLSLASRDTLINTVMVGDEKYEVETISKIQDKVSLTRKNASNVVALAIAGALTLGASSAVVTLVNTTSVHEIEEYNGNNHVMYIVPSEITGCDEIKIKALPDGRAMVILDSGKEANSYNGKKAEELLRDASSNGMLYRDVSEYEIITKKR